MSIREGIVAIAMVLGSLFLTPSVGATERFVYEAFPAPGSEVEETGNLFVMEEGGEPQPLDTWGQNPSIDTRGRLIAFYQGQKIYVTDYKGETTRLAMELGSSSGAASPQWVPGRGLITDGPDDIFYKEFGSDIPTKTRPIGWPGRQWAPTASPNGERIAFLSETNPEGEPLEGAAVFVSYLNGSGAVQVTNPESIEPVTAPTFSPDGTHLAFGAFGEFNEWEQGDIVSLSTETGLITPLTSIPEGIAWEPDWLADGRIVFTEEYWGSGSVEFLSVPGNGGETTPMYSPFSGGEWAYHFAGRQPVDWGVLTGESSGLAKRLLYLYAPTLKYDLTEDFRATSVESMTETYSGKEPEESNQLLNAEGEVIQYANPALNPDGRLIWFAKQGTQYLTDAVLADESHRLDERDGAYGEDAAPWQESGIYSDVSYGRAVYAEGHWWLQYWLWYYYNEFNLFGGLGDHEGDWEMIQVQLGEYGNPLTATYSQHGDELADVCNFDVLDWTVGQGVHLSPVVYVADGTHASYVRPGLSLGVTPHDRADGEGYVARTDAIDMLEWRPLAETIGGGYGRFWSLWPGRWGSSLGEGKSPMAPISQGDKWDYPGAFEEQAESCPTEETGSPEPRSVWSMSSSLSEPPEIQVHREGGKMHVAYDLTDGRDRGKEGIEVAVLAEDEAVTPTTSTAWRDRGGMDLPLPNGSGPYRVVARALEPGGIESTEAVRVIGSRRGTHVPPHRPSGSIPPAIRRKAVWPIRSVRRLGVVPAGALKRKEQRILRADEKLWRSPPPTIAVTLRDPASTE